MHDIKECDKCLGCINPTANIKNGQCNVSLTYIVEQQKQQTKIIYEQRKIVRY